MQGCLAKALLLESKKIKLGPKTFDATFIGYAWNGVAYRFLVIKLENGLVEVNSIIETKNDDFFENIFPWKNMANNKFKEILELSLVILLNRN